uniref:Ribosomal RNA-processing protein 42 n=1 Tax=Albugo laibachii Nc14 TaxID=890382 RepID=F0WMH8_9STRA|nr:exosome complex exonuclease RRP42like protein putati [Albugo laibachii Nc14]|eukprot:CCA22510.1 exosome complex exonuclease RRP42like protein putati [Albugo laibachii Nc14]
MQLSTSELQFIKEGIACNVRADGRSRTSHRNVMLETSLLPHSNGSARVKQQNFGTDVLASVKLEVLSPSLEAPNSGVLNVNVTCFPSISSKITNGRALDEINIELSQLMQRIFTSHKSIDLNKFCIVPSQFVWGIFVDVVVYESTGSLPDLISIAMYAALKKTLFPCVRMLGVEGDEKILQVERDPAAGEYLAATVCFPLCTTICKIGNYSVMDPTLEEELCVSTQNVVALNREGSICGIQKRYGDGAISMDELQDMTDQACEHTMALFQRIDKAIEEEREEEDEAKGKLERPGFLVT